MVAQRQGDPARAQALHEESRRVFEVLGHTGGLALALSNLGLTLMRRGDLEQAAASYAEGLGLRRELGDREQIVTTLERLAALVAARGNAARAARFVGAAAALREVAGAPLPPVDRAEHERLVVDLRQRLGEAAYQAAWNDGRRLSPAQAIADALVPEPARTPKPRGADEARGPKSPAERAGLTARELDVLRLLVEGKSDREIGEALYIGHRTVATHVASILNKLDLPSRTAAATHAVRQGLV
jgi:non-specific serine/threonine protein kinase